MPNTIGTPGYIGQVQKMDTSTPAYGPTFDAIHQQLLNNDAFLNSEILGMLQKAVNSGVTDFASIIAGLTANLNAFKFGKGAALVDGILNTLTNYGGMTDGSNLIQLDTAPAANVSPSLPGSARDDLVFLEFWFDAVTGAPKFRFRVVDGVDFVSFPEGLGASLQSTYGAAPYNQIVQAQGGTISPLAYTDGWGSTYNETKYGMFFSANERSQTLITGKKVALDDKGLFIAGDGSAGAQTALATIDGYVYAIPLFRVRRRNNTGFNPDSNPLGSRDYVSPKLVSNQILNSLNIGDTVTWTMTSVSGIQVGDILWFNGTSQNIFKVTSVNTSAAQLTMQYLGTTVYTTTVTFTNVASFNLQSDRPDGLFSNIVDASDISDLRHQVSLTGFNYQALLEKNLDLLLRGQLTTKEGSRYARDYIGLNVAAGMPDDANTILRCDFNGATINGTANGSQVAGTMNTGSPSFANGVQGQALAASTTQYVSYPVSISAGANTYSVELLFKPNWSWNDNAEHGLLSLVDAGNNRVLEVYKHTNNWIYILIGASNNYAYAQLPTGLSILNDGTWHRLLISVNNGVVSMLIDGVSIPVSYAGGSTLPGLPSAITSCRVGTSSSNGGSYANAAIDGVRISNIVRTESLLPANFDGSKGDKILDGPNGDFSQWSDDLGGISGVNGRMNPGGLSRVPNAVAGRIAVNGSEIRHYNGNGVTPGWVANSNTGGTPPAGSFDGNSEYLYVNANETVDGARTTFTFNAPSNLSGIVAINANTYTNVIKVNGSLITPNSITLNPSTNQYTVVLSSAPASGVSVQALYQTVSRHAHFIPSTKGLVIHDWTDDSLAADGANTTFFTTKYNVTTINHVRTAPSATPNMQTIQNGGYTVSGLNANYVATSAVSSGSTSIPVSGTAGFLAGQPIRISKGDGTWYFTTISSVGTNTLTVPVTTVSLPQNAIVQGQARVMFTTAPAAGTVDLVYESVYTPALGDYNRVMYSHNPYQGVIAANDSYTVLAESNAIVTSLGTGAVNMGIYSGTSGMTACTTNLPTAVADATLKNDAFIGTTRSTVAAKQMIQSTWDDVPYSNTQPYRSKRVGQTMTIGSSAASIRGIASGSITNSSAGVSTMYSEQISTSIPNKLILSQLVKDQNGLLRLLIFTIQAITNQPSLIFGGGGINESVDSFYIQSRPLIKNYGGVAA